MCCKLFKQISVSSSGRRNKSLAREGDGDVHSNREGGNGGSSITRWNVVMEGFWEELSLDMKYFS